ncbi:MAG: UDP-N-acetylenolpyruvoylglucosamine reductase [Lysobacteraceae bacterium]|nr:MAG: UDP-N-acetylenolpyruvoylglucosamine reductase [Xanthomonadaceae bacterium]
MKRLDHASLRADNTLRIDSTAESLTIVESLEELDSVYADDLIVLGGGSNVVLTADHYRHVLMPRIMGIAIADDHDDTVLVEAGAGVVWDDLVRWTVARDLWGIENLALIWGAVGAAPMQNIGAYGVELADCFESLLALHLPTGKWRTFDKSACQFGYRDSWFKRQSRNQWLIASVQLRLSKSATRRLDYAGVAQALRGDSSPSAAQVAAAVSALRMRKLPDPKIIGNAGSFFKNPVLPAEFVGVLCKEHQQLRAHSVSKNQAKISAGALIDMAGFKGYRVGDAGVSEQHALVIVNHGAARGKDILELANEIQAKIRSMFDIELEIEPVLI